jgi:hypothetical protein
MEPLVSPLVEEFCTAAYLGDIEKIRQILSKGDIDINSKNLRGQTALYCAARQGKEEIIKILLNERGIDVNVQEAHGSTALHAASFVPHPNVLSILLSYGCDMNITNTTLGTKGGLTAHAEARGGACEIWRIFKTGGTKALQMKGYPVYKKGLLMSNNSQSKLNLSRSVMEKLEKKKGLNFSLRPSVRSTNSLQELSTIYSGVVLQSPPLQPTVHSPVHDISTPMFSGMTIPEKDEITSLSELIINKQKRQQHSDDEVEEFEIPLAEFSFEEEYNRATNDRLSFQAHAPLPWATPKQPKDKGPQTPQSPPPENSLQRYWVKLLEDDPIIITFSAENSVYDFKCLLQKQFQEIAQVPLNKVFLLLEGDTGEERLDVKKKMGDYEIKDREIIVRIGV